MIGKSGAHSERPTKVGKAAAAAFLGEILASERIEIPAAAKRAGIASSTLYRIVKEDDPFAPSLTTIVKLEAAFNRKFGSGFGEAEAVPYDATQAPADFDALVAGFIGGRNGVDPWQLRTRALELAGWLPGDVVIVDLNAEPADGDLVCAQRYDDARDRVETIWRLYEKPYLIAAAADRAAFPTERDDTVIAIKGVVVATFRPRRSRDD